MKDGWQVKISVVAVSASFWVTSVLINNRLFAGASHAPGIDVIFIPSGVRLIAIMIGGIWAATGISLGSVYLTGPEFGLADPLTIMGISAWSGFAPFVSLVITMRLMGVSFSLQRLAPAHLPVISLGVAVGSSLLHNLLFSILGLQPWSAFGANCLAMATGDFVGMLLAVALIYVFLRLFGKWRRPN